MGHHDSSISQPGSFNPYLEGMSYPGGGYGLYPHHFSKLRGPHDLNGAYADYPSKPGLGLAPGPGWPRGCTGTKTKMAASLPL